MFVACPQVRFYYYYYYYYYYCNNNNYYYSHHCYSRRVFVHLVDTLRALLGTQVEKEYATGKLLKVRGARGMPCCVLRATHDAGVCGQLLKGCSRSVLWSP